MSLLPFEPLKLDLPRRFVPEQIDLGDWPQLAPLFDQLEQRAERIHSVTEMEDWILAIGELSAAIDEERSKRYIAMTCHTDHPDAERAYLHFVEQVEPEVKPRLFRLDELYVRHPLRRKLPADRYRVYDRNAEVHVRLFRPENVPLETEESKLGQQYQKLCGSLTVQFRGEEKTLVQMGRYLEEPDRSLREEAWELITRRRLQEAETVEHLFEQLLRIRERIASNAGFANYLDYAFQARNRFDYGPEACRAFHDAIESELVPVLSELQSKRQKQLQLSSLRPWDLAVDPGNRAPLRPFADVAALVTGARRIFESLDGELAAHFHAMERMRLLDLANRKGKAPGGYQCSLGEARLPFIFMNAIGLNRDVETILHEAGHAFHVWATRQEPLYAYRSAPIEFCEVASMSMELLGNEFLEVFYSSAEVQRARWDHLEGIVKLFPWVATVDAFQHWIYTHPGHSREERSAAWLGLMDRFEGRIDWSGHEPARAHAWHRQLHIFLHPFYYIEYGIAQLGALQVWSNFKKNRVAALNDYRAALGLGGSRPLPELFAAAGCRFAFNREAVGPVARLLRTELERLDGE